MKNIPELTPQDLGAHIQSARRKMRPAPTQNDFAKLIGVSRNKIVAWECGKRVPDAIEIFRVAAVTKQSVSSFFGVKEDMDIRLGKLEIELREMRENYSKK